MNSDQIINEQKEELLSTFAGAGKVIKASEKWEQIKKEKTERPPFTAKTGLPSMDECMKKIKRGHLVILSGPPKAGKTSAALTFTKHFIEQNLKCLWFPFEMGHEDILERFDTHFGTDDFDFFTPEELIDRDVEWVREKIIEAKKKFGGLDVVFIDHLDFLRNRKMLLKNTNINMSNYIGLIVQSVKTIAKEQDVVIFLLCHITKNKWTSNDLPDSENLADSRQITDLADFVLMVIRARPPKGSNEVYDGNRAILGVIENRHGGKTVKFPAELRNDFFVEIDSYTKMEVPQREELFDNHL